MQEELRTDERLQKAEKERNKEKKDYRVLGDRDYT